MIELESKVRKWGNTLGIAIPKEKAQSMELKPNQEVKVLILHKKNALAETFGTLKFKKSTDKMMREIDEELWHED
mgnify:FL=1